MQYFSIFRPMCNTHQIHLFNVMSNVQEKHKGKTSFYICRTFTHKNTESGRTRTQHAMLVRIYLEKPNQLLLKSVQSYTLY